MPYGVISPVAMRILSLEAEVPMEHLYRMLGYHSTPSIRTLYLYSLFILQEYDYINHFWSEVAIQPGTGPSARFSASGGTDPLAAAVSDGVVPGPNNTFYLAGGFDGSSQEPLSDVWKFEIAGVLASNLNNNTVGSWTQVSMPKDLPSRVRQGAAVLPSARLVVAGGCDTSDFSDNLCAQQDSHVLHVDTSSDISPSGCPAPRVGPVVIPNYNQASSSFTSQAFMLLGTFNTSLWDDDNGLARGEVVGELLFGLLLVVYVILWTIRMYSTSTRGLGAVSYLPVTQVPLMVPQNFPCLERVPLLSLPSSLYSVPIHPAALT